VNLSVCTFHHWSDFFFK